MSTNPNNESRITNHIFAIRDSNDFSNTIRDSNQTDDSNRITNHVAPL